MLHLKLEKIQFVELYSAGSQQPYVKAVFKCNNQNYKTINHDGFVFGDGDVKYENNLDIARKSTRQGPDELLSAILDLAVKLLISFNHVILDPWRLNDFEHTSANVSAEVLFPTFSPNCFIPAIKVAGNLVQSAQSVEKFHLSLKKFENEITTIRQTAPKGFNTKHLLEEAASLRMPCLLLIGNTFQIGYGARSKLFESSHTDETSVIAVNLVKNKLRTGNFLRSFGFPVAKSQAIQNENEALEFLNKTKSPVVIKPLNLDGGKGVHGWLTSPAEVQQAVNSAQKYSKHLMIEEFCTGTDYRIQVVNNKVQGIIKRQPALVKGDGITSIADLIFQTNEIRKFAEDDQRFLHEIKIDAELERILLKQGMTINSVPSIVTNVLLSAAANVALGGHPQQMDMSLAHQDNLQLCIDVCRSLRLDVAGVDLILDDIGTSWIESGAHICEVNSQPQMFKTLFKPLLEEKFGMSRGRIPIIVIHENNDFTAVEKWGRFFEGIDFLNCAVAIDGFVMKNNVFRKNNGSLFDVTSHFLKDPNVEALVVVINNKTDFSDGWPFTYCDYFLHDGLPTGKLLSIDESLRPSCVFSNFYALKDHLVRLNVIPANTS
jgi:cyanophycin synthetase